MKAPRKPRRVAIVTHLSQLFGAGISMLETTARLDPRTVEPVIVTLEPGPLEAAARARGIPLHRLEWLGGFKRRPWRVLLAAPRLAAWLRRARIDVLELNRIKYDLLAVCGLACRLTGVKLVQRERMHSKKPISGLRRRLLAGADRIVAVSRGSVAPWYEDAPPWWRRVLEERLVVLPSGRDVRGLKTLPKERGLVAALGVPDQAEIVGFLAAIDPRKRPDLFLRAAALVSAERPAAWFVLVGAPYGEARSELSAYEREMRALAAELGISGRTVFTGYREDAYRLLQNFSVMVLPSRREALGGSLIEALTAGVPAVAANVDGIPEVVTDGESGLLVGGGDPSSYASAILRILRDPSLAARLRDAGLARAELFDLGRIASGAEAVYLSL